MRFESCYHGIHIVYIPSLITIWRRNMSEQGPSDYTLRGYTSLKIKVETKSRLNDAKNEMFGRRGRVMTHDQLINLLLDQHPIDTLDQAATPEFA